MSGDNVIISGNEAGSYGNGGGISTSSGSISLANSTLSRNSTSYVGRNGGGGAIYGGVDSAVSLTNSLISQNSVNFGPNGSRAGGGAIRSLGTASLTNTTVSDNRVFGHYSTGAGGIDGVNIFLTNSTVTGNRTTAVGMSITNPTSFGGGLSASGDLSIINSIVTDNTADVSPDVSSSSSGELIVEHSLIGDTRDSGIGQTTGTGNILNEPALIGPLADNGGPTLTHLLLSGSPAIGAGRNALAVDADGMLLETDQRGSGFDRIVGNNVDIGAFESTRPPLVVSVTIDEGGVLARPDLWNTLAVVFDSDVTVAAADLSLVNDSMGSIAVDLTDIGFNYEPSTSTATWDFSTIDPLEAAFYTWRLDASSINSEGLALDGNGDEIGGDDFVSQHYVAIPGDANLDGVVDVLGDAFALVGNLGSVTNVAWADGNFDDNDAVDVLGDAFILVGNLGRDVRPPVSAGALAPSKLAVSYSGSSEVTPTPVLIAGDPEDDLDESSLRTTSNAMESRAPELALAGTHDLRDDVFGSDF